MLKKIIYTFFAIIFFQQAFAQNLQISGTVKDTSTNKSVQYAVVALLTPKDSVLKAFTRVKEDGSYQLKNVQKGKYILQITHPQFGDFIDEVEIINDNQTLASVAFTPKSKLLEAVIVKSGNPIRLKGDTTIYTADSFKVSANANVEELLKKMPGLQVDKNGKITAMGQQVQKVLVDGEEFFGDDPGMAVKNLRADAVKEVQVFDKKSDQAEFTGIDDGNTQKTINLKLKEDKKKGYFGKIDVAGGLQKNIDNRYNDNILLSSYKGKRKITGFLLNGNTGQDGISWQDEQKFGGGSDNMNVDEESGDIYFTSGGTSDGEPYVDTDNGFITNTNVGLQYSNKYNDKTSVNFSPKYNSQKYNNKQTQFTQTQIGDSVLNQQVQTLSNVNRSNIKFRGIIDTKIDSNNTLKFTANANFYDTESNDVSNSLTTGKTGTQKNTADRIFNTKSTKQAFTGNAIFKHKFKKAKRTLSLNVDFNLVESDGTNFLKSNNRDFFGGSSQNIDQMKDNDKTTTTTVTKLVYTEPLGKKYALEFGYQLSINSGNNNQFTYDYTAATGKYESQIDSLSNQFKQNITLHTPSAKISFANKKLKINAGSGISFSKFELDDISFNKKYNRNYTNYFPSASLNYTYKSNHSLTINYNGNTKQPTLNQLQPLRNNNDQFNQYIGNPDLKNSFSNNFRLNHNAYNFIKDFYTYQSAGVTFQQNAITNNRIIDANTGKTTTQPFNTNGNYNAYFYGGGGAKIKKLDVRVNFNLDGSISKYAEFINSQKSIANNRSIGTSVYLSKSKDKVYDVSISERIGYRVQTTSQNDTKNSFITNTVSAEATGYYKKVWSLITDIAYYTRPKTGNLNSINNTLFNATLQRTFKKDEYTFYVKVRDILNQNIGVERSYYSNTFSETQNDRLKRYFLVGFTWNFKNKAAATK